ncbi:MAG: hypothetical protein J6T65_04755 [Clostridia bacterium]|nr:hypothetical protein [Clostridia bacterium]
MATVEYKCPNCAAPLVFDAGCKTVKCEFCESTFNVDEVTANSKKAARHETSKIDDEYIADEKAEEYWKKVTAKTAGYSCPSCGGAIIGTVDSAALFCPYCGNPAIIESSIEGEFKPDYIIPFAKTKEDAIKAYNDFLGDGKYLPKVFRDSHAVDKVSGVYVPYHLLSCDVSAGSVYKGEIVEKWSDSDYDYEKTDTYENRRAGTISFVRIPADASSSIDDDFMETIEPFDYSGLTEFKDVYLSGFWADKYDLTPEQCQEVTDKRIANTVDSIFLDSVSQKGFTSVSRTGALNVDVRNRKYAYALLPVWLLRTKYNNEFYYFAMNGQTGKVAAKMPVDRSKVKKKSLGIGAIALAAGAVLGYIINGFWAALILGVLAGLIAFFAALGTLGSRLNNVRNNYYADSYAGGRMNFTVSDDVFKTTFTRRSPRPKRE